MKLSVQAMLAAILLASCGIRAFAQAVDVDINVNTIHEVGGITTFDRSKFITIHSDHDESDWQHGVRGANNFTSDLLADFIIGRDVYFGRNTGLISNNRRSYITQQGSTGWADTTSIISRGITSRAIYEGKTSIHSYESRSSQNIMCAQYNGFWPNGVNYNGWAFSQTDTPTEPFGTATGDYMGRFLDHFYDNGGIQTGPPSPAFVEIINEPDWHILDWDKDPDYGTAPASKIWSFHNGAANAIRNHNTNSLIGGFVTTFPDLEEQNFGEWNAEWKSFIDIAGTNMDFWSLHLYDFPVFYGNDRYRKGSNLEAMFDMIDYYSEAQLGVSRPYVISEFGSQTHEYNKQDWSSIRDWMRLKSLTSQLMTFMDRPHLMLKTIPFTVVKAEWGRGTYPYPPRLMRQANEPASYTGEWVYTDLVKFYDLWAKVNGERVYISSTDPDVQTDAYVDDNKVYIILNNIVTGTRTVDLDLIELHGNTPSSMNVKHLYWNGSAVILDEANHTGTLPTQVQIGSEAAVVLEYTFPAPVSLDQTMVESKYFASTYLQPIIENNVNVFSINGVSNLGSSGEAVLRLSIGRAHGRSKQPIVVVNDTTNSVPADIMGFETDGSDEFFGTLIIPISYSLLQVNNSVSVTFPDTGGHISTVALRIFSSDAPAADGPISIDYHEVMGSDVILGFTNGPANSFFALHSKTNLMDTLWTTNQTGLPIDGTGAGAVTNPIVAPQEFYRLMESDAPPVPASGVTVSPVSNQVFIGLSVQLTATVAPASATDKTVTWSSGTPAVASVDMNGLVTGLSEGVSIITATTTDGGFTDTGTITVSAGIPATFDWSETTGSGLSRWDTGYDYTETDNGVTMLHGGRTTTGDGQPYAIKFAYDPQDFTPGTITMEEGGVPVNFKVTSIDISQDTGTDPGSTKYVRGMLGAAIQWEIIAPVNGSVATYTAATTGNMGLAIDTIEWQAGWIIGAGYGPASTIDNLSITVVAP